MQTHLVFLFVSAFRFRVVSKTFNTKLADVITFDEVICSLKRTEISKLKLADKDFK
jgi:hypothetical protein